MATVPLSPTTDLPLFAPSDTAFSTETLSTETLSTENFPDDESLREQNARLRKRVAELEQRLDFQTAHDASADGASADDENVVAPSRFPPRDAPVSFRDEDGRVVTEKDYRQMAGRLVAAQEEERRRVSRELHDELGQHLTALKMGLDALPDFEGDSLRAPSSNRRIRQLQDLTDELMQRVQRIAWELRPAALDDLGLEAALERYVRDWAQRCPEVQLDFHMRGFERVPPLDAALQTTFYRVIQESLTNVMRHAGAQHASVVMERRDHQVTTIIEDDGRGFDVEKTLSQGTRLGILGMSERLKIVGGTLTIESEKDIGTTIYARVPVVFTNGETEPRHTAD